MKWDIDSACSAGWVGWLLFQLGLWRQLRPQEAVMSDHVHSNVQVLFWFCSTFQKIWNLRLSKEISYLNLLMVSQGITVHKEEGWSFTNCRHSHPNGAEAWKDKYIFKDIISNIQVREVTFQLTAITAACILPLFTPCITSFFSFLKWLFQINLVFSLFQSCT